VLDAMPAYVFVVDKDVRILEYNAAAAALLSADRQQVLRQRGGEVLHCIHATEAPEGCGRAEFCKTCSIRKAVNQTFAGKNVTRSRGRFERAASGVISELYIMITASHFEHEGQGLALLTLEDISEIVELRRIVPICMHCKKVRDDDQYWKQVEAYFLRHWDLRFSHGLCPDCAKVELAKLEGRPNADSSGA
jgi:nitrogen fixation/metabolism regulation signal transduction histidine kinase